MLAPSAARRLRRHTESQSIDRRSVRPSLGLDCTPRDADVPRDDAVALKAGHGLQRVQSLPRHAETRSPGQMLESWTEVRPRIFVQDFPIAC